MAKEDGGSLPPRLFPEFVDYERLTWGDFLATYRNLELNHYLKSVDVIMTYGSNTMTAVKIFEAQLDSKHLPEEADFILTTCHSAKGLEWDHVEILDDFLDLQERSYICNNKADHCSPFLSPTSTDSEAD
jgi:superfamily I DNA/RNA helicase